MASDPRPRRRALLTAILLAVAAPAASGPCDEAARRYDLEAASLGLVQARADHRRLEDPTSAETLARCTLVVAELLRLRLETAPPSEPEERLVLGQRIDAASEEGLLALDLVAETSESARLRADLLATMIRSPYRAKKHEPAFRAALERALQLDRDNPRALVTQAKPLVFAAAEHGGDPAAALPILDHALELDPGLESARLLRALARHKSGDDVGAEDDWRRALELNPACTPARQQLEGRVPEPVRSNAVQ